MPNNFYSVFSGKVKSMFFSLFYLYTKHYIAIKIQNPWKILAVHSTTVFQYYNHNATTVAQPNSCFLTRSSLSLLGYKGQIK